jgi:hypothetical protein
MENTNTLAKPKKPENTSSPPILTKTFHVFSTDKNKDYITVTE